MLKIGLTGGIGSGKSIAGKVFALLEIPVYQADVAAKRLYDTDENLRKALKVLFGNDIYRQTGRQTGRQTETLDRTKLAEIIFSNAENLQKINRLVHPAVISDFNDYVASLHESVPYVIHESAILFEAGMKNLFDATVNVCAPDNVKIQRLLRRGLSENEIKRRMTSQWSDKLKKEYADFNVINDDKTLVIPQILNIHEQLSEYSRKTISE
jgi:dephospho-CoA kinase